MAIEVSTVSDLNIFFSYSCAGGYCILEGFSFTVIRVRLDTMYSSESETYEMTCSHFNELNIALKIRDLFRNVSGS